MGNGKKILAVMIAVVLVTVMALMAPTVAWEPDYPSREEMAENYPSIYDYSSGPETILTEMGPLTIVLIAAVVVIFLAFLLLLREKRKTEEFFRELRTEAEKT